MNGDDLQGNYAAHMWSWDWMGKNIAIHPKVRPSDIDGWVHQCGEMLMLEGKVTEERDADISTPQRMAWRQMKNVTVLLIHTDHAYWVDNKPTRVRGYRVFPSAGFPWEGAKQAYQPLQSDLSDEETLRSVINVVVGWSWWAATQTRETS